jgi:hypothetical protein
MTVELWYGSKPANAGEQNVLIDLYDFLQSQSEHFVLMSNFHAGRSHEIDLMVLKRKALFIAELKHFWDKIAGGKEGRWAFIRPDGSKGTFRNPYKQVRSSSFGWQDWCRGSKDEIVQISGRKWKRGDFQPLEYIVVYPELHPESELDIGKHPVQAVGLSKFRTALVIRTVPELDFTKDELQAISHLLELTRWHIEPPTKGDSTVRLDTDDFEPPIVRMLVARGHDFSQLVFHLEKEVIIIGRDPDNDLVIHDESVSRQHAEIRRHDGRWVVQDLDSLNGTFVSYSGDPQLERRIEQENALKNGSIVRFGQASYTFLLHE